MVSLINCVDNVNYSLNYFKMNVCRLQERRICHVMFGPVTREEFLFGGSVEY